VAVYEIATLVSLARDDLSVGGVRSPRRAEALLAMTIRMLMLYSR